MYKFVLVFMTIFSLSASAETINSQIRNMKAGGDLITSVQLTQTLVIEVILDKTVRGNGTLLIGNTLLKIRDANADDMLTYQNEYLDVFFHDVNSDGVKDIIVSGITKQIADKGKKAALKPLLFIYTYSVKQDRLIELFRNSVVEINLSK